MTRTELIQIASQIKRRPIESLPAPFYSGTVYTGLFIKRPMFCFFDLDERLIAVAYKAILYCVNPVSRLLAASVKDFYYEHRCVTKVMLYKNKSNTLFIDEEGRYRSQSEAVFAENNDYQFFIPIPRV